MSAPIYLCLAQLLERFPSTYKLHSVRRLLGWLLCLNLSVHLPLMRSRDGLPQVCCNCELSPSPTAASDAVFLFAPYPRPEHVK